jgi:hypothetical protein
MVPLWLGTGLGGSLQEYGTSVAGNRARSEFTRIWYLCGWEQSYRGKYQYVMAKGTLAAFMWLVNWGWKKCVRVKGVRKLFSYGWEQSKGEKKEDEEHIKLNAGIGEEEI